MRNKSQNVCTPSKVEMPKKRAERYSASLDIDPLRRFHSIEDSSRGGA